MDAKAKLTEAYFEQFLLDAVLAGCTANKIVVDEHTMDKVTITEKSTAGKRQVLYEGKPIALFSVSKGSMKYAAVVGK